MTEAPDEQPDALPTTPEIKPEAEEAKQPIESKEAQEPDELSQAIAELGDSKAPDLSQHIETRESSAETEATPKPQGTADEKNSADANAQPTPQVPQPPAPTKAKNKTVGQKSKAILLIALIVVGGGIGAGYYLGLLNPNARRMAAAPITPAPIKPSGPTFKPRKPEAPPAPKTKKPKKAALPMEPAKPVEPIKPEPIEPEPKQPPETTPEQPIPQPVAHPTPAPTPIPATPPKPEPQSKPTEIQSTSLEKLAQAAKQYREYRDMAQRIRQATMHKNGSWAITQSQSLQEHALKPMGGLAIKNFHLVDQANRLYALIIIHHKRGDELQIKTHWPKVKAHFSTTMKQHAETLRANRGYFSDLEAFKLRAEQLIWGGMTKQQLPMVEIYAAPLP